MTPGAALGSGVLIAGLLLALVAIGKRLFVGFPLLGDRRCGEDGLASHAAARWTNGELRSHLQRRIQYDGTVAEPSR